MLVQRLEEMLWQEEVRDPVERIIVDEDRAEQALFRLDIVRRRAVGGSGGGGQSESGRIGRGHLSSLHGRCDGNAANPGT